MWVGRYDDEWGDYRMVVGDHIGYRFEVLSRLGKGSFGQVIPLLKPLVFDLLLVCLCAIGMAAVQPSAVKALHCHTRPMYNKNSPMQVLYIVTCRFAYSTLHHQQLCKHLDHGKVMYACCMFLSICQPYAHLCTCSLLPAL